MTQEQIITTGPGLKLGEFVSFGRGITAEVGEFLRFDALGNFRQVLDFRTNGLGRDYRVEADGSLTRDVF